LRARGDQAAAHGVISSGTVYAGYAPAGSFGLTVDGRTVDARPVFGWAGEYPATSGGPATLALHRFPFVPLAVLIELLGWVVLAGALAGWLPARRRRPHKATEP
jgi:hypothetical protein